MESYHLRVTSAAVAHGRILVTPCGRSFFPADSFGKASKVDGLGRPIRLQVIGIPETIETDLPTDRAGRPRWFFRDRKWLLPHNVYWEMQRPG